MSMEQYLLSPKFSFGELSYIEVFTVPLMSIALKQCLELVFTDEKTSFLSLS